jgi:hypothetical protein
MTVTRPPCIALAPALAGSQTAAAGEGERPSRARHVRGVQSTSVALPQPAATADGETTVEAFRVEANLRYVTAEEGPSGGSIGFGELVLLGLEARVALGALRVHLAGDVTPKQPAGLGGAPWQAGSLGARLGLGPSSDLEASVHLQDLTVGPGALPQAAAGWRGELFMDRWKTYLPLTGRVALWGARGMWTGTAREPFALYARVGGDVQLPSASWPFVRDAARAVARARCRAAPISRSASSSSGEKRSGQYAAHGRANQSGFFCGHWAHR